MFKKCHTFLDDAVSYETNKNAGLVSVGFSQSIICINRCLAVFLAALELQNSRAVLGTDRDQNCFTEITEN